MVKKNKKLKGIVLAGGNNTRLYPLTSCISKHLIPVYDKPMIYYPISVLMLAGIKNILIITRPDETNLFKKLLGDGSQLGIKFEYKAQRKPRGIAESLIIGEDFIGEDNICLVLGDNIFYGYSFSEHLNQAKTFKNTSTIFSCHVNDPEQFGVIKFNNDKPIDIIEKPKIAPSNYVITGLYFYENEVIKIAKKLRPSKRGELEVSDINRQLLKNNKMQIQFFGRGFTWLDTGTPNSLLQASQFIQASEKRQGLKIGCLEEIAYSKKMITKNQLKKLMIKYKNTTYGEYLQRIITSRTK